MPAVPDQFPVIKTVGANTGGGNDWRVLQLGYNSGPSGHIPETHFERYGVFMPVSFVPAPQDGLATTYGYGMSNPPMLNSTQQQTGAMMITGVAGFPGTPPIYYYNTWQAIATGGNSGGGLIYEDYLVGVVTHCNTGLRCGQTSTRVDHPDFKNAIIQSCPACKAPPANLKGWWPMDSFTTGAGTPDMIAGRDARDTGAAFVLTPAVIGKGLNFAPGGNYLYVQPTGSDYDFGPGGGTIDAWVRMNAGSSGGFIAWALPPGGFPGGYVFDLIPSGNDYSLHFSAQDPGGATLASTSTSVLSQRKLPNGATELSACANLLYKEATDGQTLDAADADR